MFSNKYGALTTTFIKNEVRYMDDKHHLIYLCEDVIQNDENINLIKLPFKLNPIIKKLRWILWQNDILCTFKNKKYAKKLNSILDEENPDIIHCHFAYEGLKLLENISIENCTPIVLHFHGYGASQMLRKKSYIKLLSKILENKNIHPICVSDYMKKSLLNKGILNNQATVLRYGIDVSKFNPSDGLEKNIIKINFLQVSSLAEKKGHSYTLQAIALFLKKNPEFKQNTFFTFTGHNKAQIEYLNALSIELDIDNFVHFIGNVKPDIARDLMANSNYFIHHSVEDSKGDKEGIPNAIMEAMAMKLPVLSTYHSGIPELVEHNKNGLLCVEKDIDTFSNQLKEILSWNKLLINREKIIELYSYEGHNRQLENLYFKLIND